MIAHWDEVDSVRAEAGHLAGEWANLGAAAGTKTVGLKRIRVDPGKWSTPFHRQTGEEEIFFVLGGSGVCLLSDRAFEVGPGDCIVHRVHQSHTLRAGDDGLDVLAFGERGRDGGCPPAAGARLAGSAARGSRPAPARIRGSARSQRASRSCRSSASAPTRSSTSTTSRATTTAAAGGCSRAPEEPSARD